MAFGLTSSALLTTINSKCAKTYTAAIARTMKFHPGIFETTMAETTYADARRSKAVGTRLRLLLSKHDNASFIGRGCGSIVMFVTNPIHNKNGAQEQIPHIFLKDVLLNSLAIYEGKLQIKPIRLQDFFKDFPV